MTEKNPLGADAAHPDRLAGARPGLPGLLAPLLCLLGLGVAGYLTVVHYGLLLGDVSLGAACGAAGAAADCNSVIASRYGELLGVPVSVWGMWYYILAGSLALGAAWLEPEEAAPFVRALLGVTIVALAIDAYLAWAMAWRLERFCPLCVATYAINAGILAAAILAARRLRGVPARMGSLVPSVAILRRRGEPAYYPEVLKLFLSGLGAGGGVIVLVLSLAFSSVALKSEREQTDALVAYLGRAQTYYLPTRGLPARGPEEAPFTIVVFSDFLCAKCKLASEYLDIVQADLRDSLRVVYLHYPMDKACNENVRNEVHPGACALAAAAECANRQGRFWEFHQAVYADPGRTGPDDIRRYAAEAGLDAARFGSCIERGEGLGAVKAQIAFARSVGVEATPTSYINGRPVIGALRPRMLEAALAAVRKLPVPSPPRDGGE